MALIAGGDTRPLLIAGIIRASALAMAVGAAAAGWGLIGIAVAGIAGEFASLVYVAWRVDQDRPGLGATFLVRTAVLAAAALISVAAARALPPDAEAVTGIVAALFATGCMLGTAVFALPGLKALLQSMRARSLQPTGEQIST
jgi:hypothetical protein